MLNYKARPFAADPKTLGDLRAALATGNSSGVPNPGDLSGFWKEDCGEDFGLRIKHLGNGGMYSISFCGPGGCSAPGHPPDSSITQDPAYEVVAAGKALKVRGSDGWAKYQRCETDPMATPQRQAPPASTPRGRP